MVTCSYWPIIRVGQHILSVFNSQHQNVIKVVLKFLKQIYTGLSSQYILLAVNKRQAQLLESIQGIYKRPTYRFGDTIVWERWHFWRAEINIDYCLIQCIRGFIHLPCPSSNLVYRSLELTLMQCKLFSIQCVCWWNSVLVKCMK